MSLIEATSIAYKNLGIDNVVEEHEGIEALRSQVVDDQDREFFITIIDGEDLVTVAIQNEAPLIAQSYKYCNVINSLSDMKYYYNENNGAFTLENKLRSDTTVEELMACVSITLEEAIRYASSYMKAVDQ